MVEKNAVSTRPSIVVCIPAKDEEKSIAKVVIKATRHAERVIVCDDGSTDLTGEISKKLGALVIRHEKNMGKGEALRSLVLEAMKFEPKCVVTIDADGQHDPEEIGRVAGPVLSGEADIVIGVRPMKSRVMPPDRIVGNKILDSVTSAAGGNNVKLHDTQSGFRAYSMLALEKLNFSQSGMAVESQTLIDAVSTGLRITEVPVTTTYVGIVPKRNPANQFSHILDYIMTRTIAGSPLLYLGVPGLLGIIIGIVAGLRVVSIFANSHQIAAGTALIAVILIVVGAVMVSTSIIVKLLKIQALS